MLTIKPSTALFLLQGILIQQLGYAQTKAYTQDFLYGGVIGGVGSTTWYGLVPGKKNQNQAINMSTPINVQEGGTVWGALLGYQLASYFAVEGNYYHYTKANITFDAMSLFSFDHDGLLFFSSQTELVSLIGKIFMPFPKTTDIRIYSSAGVAYLHREDLIINSWRVSPTFGVGLNYRFNEHFMTEVAINYTAGFGESRLSPADSFFPFLYSGSLKLAYCFA